VSWQDDIAAANAVVLQTFGDVVAGSYAPKSGAGAFPVTGIFDEAFHDLELDPRSGASNSIVRPVLGVDLSQFAAPPVQGDRWTRAGGGTYLVKNVEPDSHGWALLKLNASQ
jgi:hypothetical protein